MAGGTNEARDLAERMVTAAAGALVAAADGAADSVVVDSAATTSAITAVFEVAAVFSRDVVVDEAFS